MKKYIAQVAVVACVAFFALNNQAQAASLHISFGSGKDKVCCVQQPHRHELKKQVKHHNPRHDMRMDKRRREVAARNRKECCHHGR